MGHGGAGPRRTVRSDPPCVSDMTVGKDQEVTVKSKGAGGQGKVAAKVTGPAGKPVASKVSRDPQPTRPRVQP